MAKILLNIDLNAKSASAGIDALKASINDIAESLANVKPDKSLTAQINALSRYYKSLADAASKASKAQNDAALADQKLAQAAARTAKAQNDAAAAETRRAKATVELRRSVNKLTEETESAQGAQDKFNKDVASAGAGFLSYGAAMMAARAVLRTLKKAYEEISEILVETENRVIEIRRVLNEDDMRTPEEIANRLYDIAQEYGTTFENASEIAVKFARAGRTWNESLEATRAALLAVNVAELSADQASEGLLSIIQQYGMETSDLIDVVDKLNKVSDKNPVTTEKMLYALQRAGSAAKNANISFEETLGLITSLSEATNRSGQNIGTAINSLIQYSTKNVDTFASLSEEAAKMVDRFKHGQASIVDVWKQVAVEIQNNKDRVADLLAGDEMEELTSSLHDELGDLLTETEGVYSVANTYRKNYFIALLDNMDRYEKTLEDTREVQGYSAKEQEQYMDTYTAKINAAKAAWQEVANTMTGILHLKKMFAELSESVANSVRDDILYLQYKADARLKSTPILSYERFLESDEYYRRRYGKEREPVVSSRRVKPNLPGPNDVSIYEGEVQYARGAEAAAKATVELTEASEDLVDVAEREKKKFDELSEALNQAQKVLDTLTKAQAEYDETGELSVDTVQTITALGAEYVDLLVDENGKINLNASAVEKLIEKQKELLRQTQAHSVAEYAATTLNEYMTRTTENVADAAETASQRVELAAEAMMRFSGNGEGAAQAASDFAAALDALAGSKGVLGEDWESEWRERVMNYASDLSALTGAAGFSGKKTKSDDKNDPELERLKDVVSLRKSELTLLEAQGATEEARARKIGEIKASLKYQIAYMRETGAEQEDLNALVAEWWRLNKEAAALRQEAAERERKQYEERIALLKSELSLYEARGDDMQTQVETIKAIQSAITDEVEYLRRVGASEEEINELSAEWYEWQEKIAAMYQKTLEAAQKLEEEAMQAQIDAILDEIDAEKDALELSEKRLAVDRARATLEEAIANAKAKYVSSMLKEYLTSIDTAATLEQKQAAVSAARENLAQAQRKAQIQAIADAFRAQREGTAEVLALDEKRLAIEEARRALDEARENRTVKVYNAATGVWEWQANAEAVKSAEERLSSAVDALNSAVEKAAWDEVQAALESGSLSEAELRDILAKWASEGYGTGSPEYVAKITEAYRAAMGTPAAPGSVAGELSGVQTAVNNLNDYLKDQAIGELTEYIEAGNTDEAGMREILDRWLKNGEGAEIWKWEEDILKQVDEAIQSGKYDDEDVRSAIDGVTNAVDALREYMSNRFVSEVSMLIKTATAQELQHMIDKWRQQEGDLNAGLIGWAERLVSAKLGQEEVERMFAAAQSGNVTGETRNDILSYMQANSQAWHNSDPERQQTLADLNYALGTALGLHRGEDGIWYDEGNNRVYDRGGVLTGTGGIKATSRPEIVLDPALTRKILTPQSDAHFRAFSEAMHLMFERGGGATVPAPVPSVSRVDSHNVSHTINGVPIPAAAAETYTIAELARLMQIV